MAAAAASGRAHGAVPHGCERQCDPKTGAVQGQIIKSDEAAVVRELFARVIAGHSIKSIAADFAARNIVRENGTPFPAVQLTPMLRYRCHDGRRIHRPADPSQPVTIVDAEWEPIIDHLDLLEVRRVLEALSRKKHRAGRAVHLLGMIAKCDICESRSTAR